MSGHTDHNSGYCVSFAANFLKMDSYDWVLENCAAYGFIQRFPPDKAEITGIGEDEKVGYNYEECFRYVGIPHATYMTENDLCLEEYIELLCDSYTFDGEHLLITGSDGNEYSVYYTAVSDDDLTTLNVPSNFSYTVSGDNRGDEGGFIVTVNLSDPIE